MGSGEAGEVLSIDDSASGLALGVLASLGLGEFVDVFAVLLELALDALVGVAQVVLHLVLQLLDDLVQLVGPRGRDDLGIVEELLHEVVMGELARLRLLLSLVLPARRLRGRLLLPVTLGLLGRDDLHALLLGPHALLQLLLQVHCLLLGLGGLGGLGGGGGVEPLAVIDQEGAVVDLLLVAVGAFALLALLGLCFFGLTLLLLPVALLLLAQFLPLALGLLRLPLLPLLLLDLGGPGNPADLLLLVLVLLSLVRKVLLGLRDLVAEVVDLLLEGLALLVEGTGLLVVLLLGRHLLDLGNELRQVLADAVDLPVHLLPLRQQLLLLHAVLLQRLAQLLPRSLRSSHLRAGVHAGGLGGHFAGGVCADAADLGEQLVQLDLLLLAQVASAHLVLDELALDVQLPHAHLLQLLVRTLGRTGLSLELAEVGGVVIQLVLLAPDLAVGAGDGVVEEVEVGVEHLDALAAEVHLALDLLDAVVVGAVGRLDLLLLLPPLLLHRSHAALQLLHALVQRLLVRLVPRLLGEGRDLSAVVDVGPHVLEPEAGALLLFRPVLWFPILPAHPQSINNIQYMHESPTPYSKHRSHYIFFQMIRVHALFPNTRPQREIATQTDQLLPSIARKTGVGWKANRMAHSQVDSSHVGKGSPKGASRQRWFCAEGGTEGERVSSVAVFGSPTGYTRYPRGMKENACLSPSSSKLQAKAFKFLQFEEDHLRNAILKHLDGRELSRQERSKIRQKVHFSFLLTNSNVARSKFDEDFTVIEIPEEERIAVSLAELVDQVREAYAELGVGSKGRDVMLSALHRRIAQVTQSLLAQGDRPVPLSALSAADNPRLLANYLRQYVGESERTAHCFSPNEGKLKLLGFYQEVYNKYEAVPFSEESEEPLILPSEEPTAALILKSPTSTVSHGKSSVNSDESFIKLRFYNNLRKEVQTLSEDTEKIMQEESNKMGHP